MVSPEFLANITTCLMNYFQKLRQQHALFMTQAGPEASILFLEKHLNFKCNHISNQNAFLYDTYSVFVIFLCMDATTILKIWIFSDVVKVKITLCMKIIHNHPNKVFNTFCCYGKQRASWGIKFIPSLFAFMQGRDLYICLDFGVIWLVLWETYILAGWNCFEVFINAVSHPPTS